MSRYALLICRSQTEAIGLRRHLGQMGVPAHADGVLRLGGAGGSRAGG